jgi:hypothetical protein
VTGIRRPLAERFLEPALYISYESPRVGKTEDCVCFDFVFALFVSSLYSPQCLSPLFFFYSVRSLSTSLEHAASLSILKAGHGMLKIIEMIGQ